MVWEKESLWNGHRLACKTVQKIADRYGTKRCDGGCREPSRGVIFASSIEENIVQLTGEIWFQIPFENLHLDAAKLPDML